MEWFHIGFKVALGASVAVVLVSFGLQVLAEVIECIAERLE